MPDLNSCLEGDKLNLANGVLQRIVGASCEWVIRGHVDHLWL